MILVTGATGHFGKATIDSLLEKGIATSNLVALVRSEGKATTLRDKGVQIRTGDYNNYDALKAAFRGVDKLLLVSSSDIKNDRLTQHKNAINAAIENGVQHIAYTGMDIKDFETTAIPHVMQVHIDTANYLKGIGIPYTLLNNNLYADLLPMFLGKNPLETGIFFPAGNGKTPFAARTDMAAAAAVVLTTPGHENKEYVIRAETAYSFAEIAEALSEIAGKEVKYLAPDADTYIAQLVKGGVPKESATFLAGFGVAIGKKEFETNRSDLKTLLGKEPIRLKEFLKSIYSK